MATVAEKSDYTTDFALIFIERICQFLSIKDLGHLAQVCRTWNKAVNNEIQLRGMERIILYEESNKSLFSNLRVKPYIALLFIQQYFDAPEPRELLVCNQFIKRFPHVLIAVGADSVITEKNIVDTTKYNENKSFKFNPDPIPCLIIPNHEKMEVKYSWYTREQIKTEKIENIINGLTPNNKQLKTVLMIFTFGCNKNCIKNMMNSVKKSFNKNSLALWGSELFFCPFANKCKDGVDENQHIGFLGISISCSNIDVYSTIMPCQTMKISTFYQDLVKFKDSVKLKQHSMAFINGPVFEDCYLNSSDEENGKEMRKVLDEFYTEDYEKCFLYHLKKLFPNVPLIGTFRDNIFKSFGIDLMNGSSDKFDHKEALSIMIITYN